ncbi:glycosyltransferase family 39 protein [bacterium]|nr:glycosyltransferase family 39 protein [bacterium]
MHLLRPLRWLAPLVVALPLLLWHVAEPWTGSFDANGACFGLAARNTLRYGLWATRGGQIIDGGVSDLSDVDFYAHHPPALPLTVAASFAVFGEREWAARLVPIAFTLGAVALLFWLGSQLAGPWAGCLASVAFVLQPMVAFYGRMPDHEAPATFFALLTACAYVRWHRSSEGRWLALASAAAAVGVLYGWIVFVLPWLLLVHAGLTRKNWRAALWPCGAALAAFLCVLAHIAALKGGLGELWWALGHRTGSQAVDRIAGVTFGRADMLRRQGSYFLTAYNWVTAALLPLWLLGFGRKRRSDTLLVAALALFALANIFGFPQGAYVHIYYQFYLAIPLALVAGLTLDGLGRRRLGWVAAIVVVGMATQGMIRLQVFHGTYDSPESKYARQFALAPALHRLTKPTDRVLLVWDVRASFRQLMWEADRHVTVVPDAQAAEHLTATHQFDVQFVVTEDDAGGAALRPWSGPARPPGR